MSSVHLELDEDLLALLDPSAQRADRAVLEIVVTDLFRRHAISAGRAAEVPGIDERAFVDRAAAQGILAHGMSLEEWRDEAERIRNR